MLIPLPSNLDIKEAKGHKATVNIEPCFPGYGVTLGNALRRVLLSSIEGTAITSFKIANAPHEFSTLPHVKEDLVEIILNLKKIRLHSFSNEPVKLDLNVKGEKVVTAGDIVKNAEVEVINPETPILTLTDKSAQISIEFTVAKGMGYVTVEERAKEKVELGTIIIDAIYSPIVNVGFDIENVRVGERTDFDRLVLKIETDGSINPKDALMQASEILVSQFQFVGGLSTAKKAKKEEKEDTTEIEAAPIKIAKETVKEEAKESTKKRGRPKKGE